MAGSMAVKPDRSDLSLAARGAATKKLTARCAATNKLTAGNAAAFTLTARHAAVATLAGLALAVFLPAGTISSPICFSVFETGAWYQAFNQDDPSKGYDCDGAVHNAGACDLLADMQACCVNAAGDRTFEENQCLRDLCVENLRYLDGSLIDWEADTSRCR